MYLLAAIRPPIHSSFLRLYSYPCFRDRQPARCSLSPARNVGGTSRPVPVNFRFSRLSSTARCVARSAVICPRKYCSDESISWSIGKSARGQSEVRPRHTPATNQSRNGLSGSLFDCRNPARAGATGECAGGAHATGDRGVSGFGSRGL